MEPKIPPMPAAPGPWYLVRFDDERVAWMHEDWLDRVGSADQVGPDDEDGDEDELEDEDGFLRWCELGAAGCFVVEPLRIWRLAGRAARR